MKYQRLIHPCLGAYNHDFLKYCYNKPSEEEMFMTNYEIDARFVYGPRHTHFPTRELKVVENVLRGEITSKDEPRIRELMRHFPHLNAFQSALGEITGMDAYDPRIQEAYWIGNSLLNVSPKDAGRVLLTSYKKNNLPKPYVKEIEKVSEKGIILHHNFQVTKIAVIDSGGLEKSLDAVNNCMIRSAKIRKISKNGIDVDTMKLSMSKPGYKLKENIEEVNYDKDLVGELHLGKTVALHWGGIAVCLDEDQYNELNHWTNKVVDLL